MSVPILTIPESSFDPASYNNLNTANITKSQSQILLYIIKLTRRSSIGLILFYILGLFIIKPLMELNVTRRKDYLDYIRGKLRDFYLKSITKVQYIPIVAIKNKQTGKLYSDAIIQTDNNNNNKLSTNSTGDDDSDDRLGQNQLYKKLTKLSLLLTEGIRNYSTIELSNYKSINYSIKDLQNKSDLVYFNQNDLFVMDNGGSGGGGVSSIMTTSGNTMKKKDLAVEIKNEIRSIKGLYMSGQV